MWEKILIGSFTTYALSLLLVDGAIFEKTRLWLRPRTRFLIIGNKWLFACRFCIGFWISLVIAFFIGKPLWFLAILGISHWLSMQERKA